MWTFAGEFPEIVLQAKSILERFMEALSCTDQCFIADKMLEQLPTPTQVGKTKVGGIDLNRPRMRWVVGAVIALSPSPGGFTASQLAGQIQVLSKQSPSDYGARRYESLPKGLKSDGRAGGAERPSDQTVTGRRTGATAITRHTESHTDRYALRHDSHGHARRLPGTGPRRVNIDNYFVGPRP